MNAIPGWRPGNPNVATPAVNGRGIVLVSSGVLGAGAIATQLVLMRELWEALSGNELILGIVLGSWLLLGGVGAALAGRIRGPSESGQWPWILLGVLAWLPFPLVLAARGCRDVLFPRGVMVNAEGAMLASILLLAPYCVISGALLARFPAILARSGESHEALRRVYVADTIGGALGGAAFSLLLAPRWDSFLSLAPYSLLELAAAWSAGTRLTRGLLASLSAGVLAVTLLMWGNLDADRRSSLWNHPGETLVARVQSPYGRILVMESAGQVTFYGLGVPWLATGDRLGVEEAAHYAMSQRPWARQVLVLGGAASGVAREVLRYPSVRTVIGVEQDPAVVEAVEAFCPENLGDPRLTIVIGDARRYVERTKETFDVIVVESPDPNSALLNRLHTVQFLAAAKRCLRREGVLAYAAGGYANVVGGDLAAMLAVEGATLGRIFRHTLALPGQRVRFLASDGSLFEDVAGRLEAVGVRPLYVNRNSLEATLAPDRVGELNTALAKPARLNTDFSPELYRLTLRRWTAQMGGEYGWLAGLAGLFVAGAWLVRGSMPARVLWVGGFSATSLEVILLVVFQTLTGTLYRQTGLFFAVFMVGMAVGGFHGGGRLWGTRPLGTLAAAIGLLAALIPFLARLAVWPQDGGGGFWQASTVLLATTAVLAWLVGALFATAATVVRTTEHVSVAGLLFSADLLGAALGAWVASAWLVPVAGVDFACAGIALINLLMAAHAGLAEGRVSQNP